MKFVVAPLVLLLPLGIAAFPINSLAVDDSTISQLNQTGPAAETAANGLLLPEMRKLFEEAKYAIKVEQGDVLLTAQFPDESVDDDCHHKITAESPKATGKILNSSTMRWGLTNVSWHGATVFVDAAMDAGLEINTNVCVRVGERLFHHCAQIARKTVGLDVSSDGHVGLGINMTASNAHLEFVNGTLSLVFNFHASVVGNVITWHVEKVIADRCKIKLLGIQILSVCGAIERKVKAKAQVLTDKVTRVDAPKLLKKLEDSINTLIGSKVVIPLIKKKHEKEDSSVIV